ncbi:MAG: phosphoglucosamine mutase [Candidatus Paceibacterota bacterium]
MPIKPTFTVSGYRGVWGDTMNTEIASLYARAFIKFLKHDQENIRPKILIGRDGRESGPEIKEAIIKELIKYGVDFVDGEILPTPTVMFSVRKHGYDGAIIITASHNPIEYNGLKFVNNKAFFLEEHEATKINSYMQADEDMLADKTPGTCINDVMEIPNFTKEHGDKIVESVDKFLIRDKAFRVAVDMINASACEVDPYLFGELGVELVPINNIPNGKFAHKPEPNTENLKDVSEFVKNSNVDLGFVHDPDADRLVVIDEHGEVVFEEYTLALCVENILSKNPNQKIAINLSTSRMSLDIAEKYDSTCYMAKVGEPNVVREMIKNNTIIGGEGNGGVIYPTVNLARDSFVGIALILELLAMRDQKVSEVIATLPKHFMKKGKYPMTEALDNKINKLKERFSEAKSIEIDGVRLDFPDKAWLHLHPSNTEPIFRLYGEASTSERIEELFAQAELTFESN